MAENHALDKHCRVWGEVAKSKGIDTSGVHMLGSQGGFAGDIWW